MDGRGGAGRSPGSTESPDSAVMGRDDLRHRHGVLRRGSAGGPPHRVAHLSHCVKSQDALVRTSPERNGWRRCFGARICSAVVRGPAVQHGSPKGGVVRNIELRPVSQTGMIEVLTMHRQYSPQKKFLFLVRNFRCPGEPAGRASAIDRRIRDAAPIGRVSWPRVRRRCGNAVPKVCSPVRRFGAGVHSLAFGPRRTTSAPASSVVRLGRWPV